MDIERSKIYIHPVLFYMLYFLDNSDQPAMENGKELFKINNYFTPTG